MPPAAQEDTDGVEPSPAADPAPKERPSPSSSKQALRSQVIRLFGRHLRTAPEDYAHLEILADTFRNTALHVPPEEFPTALQGASSRLLAATSFMSSRFQIPYTLCATAVDLLVAGGFTEVRSPILIKNIIHIFFFVKKHVKTVPWLIYPRVTQRFVRVN